MSICTVISRHADCEKALDEKSPSLSNLNFLIAYSLLLIFKNNIHN